jgi:hypothetical protein
VTALSAALTTHGGIQLNRQQKQQQQKQLQSILILIAFFVRSISKIKKRIYI